MLRLGQEGALVAVHHGKNRGDAEEVFREIEQQWRESIHPSPPLGIEFGSARIKVVLKQMLMAADC